MYVGIKFNLELNKCHILRINLHGIKFEMKKRDILGFHGWLQSFLPKWAPLNFPTLDQESSHLENNGNSFTHAPCLLVDSWRNGGSKSTRALVSKTSSKVATARGTLVIRAEHYRKFDELF